MKTISINKTNRTKNLEAIRAKRAELKELSQPFKPLVKMGAIKSINEGLRRIYADQGHTVLKTLRQWNTEGMRVIKGEHAFLLWGAPVSKSDKKETESTDNETEYYPICFVFSQKQVEKYVKQSN